VQYPPQMSTCSNAKGAVEEIWLVEKGIRVCFAKGQTVNDISATSSHTRAASTSCLDSSTHPDSFEDSFKQSLTNG
jgi:hypothetical protein